MASQLASLDYQPLANPKTTDENADAQHESSNRRTSWMSESGPAATQEITNHEEGSPKSPCEQARSLSPELISFGQQKDLIGPTRTSSFQWFSKLSTLEDWWFFELLGVLGAAGALIGIIVVLWRYDNEPQPQWDGISLNSLVSWLSTVAKACVLMPVTKGLSQLKWVWFAERDRPLADIAVFDAASRGLVGSAELLWHLRGRHFAVLGSVAVILSLGFDPFTQNLIQYYAQSVPDMDQVARLANASTYETVGPGIGGNVYYVDPVLKSNVYSALFNTDPTAAWATPQYFCSTGNCNWGPVSTFAYCPQCSDVSASLNYSCPVGSDSFRKNCTVSLPDSGYSLWYRQMSPSFSNGVVMTMGPNTAKSNATSVTYNSIRAVVNDSGLVDSTGDNVVSSNLSSNTTFIGTECAIVPCVRSFHASVVNGTYREQDIGAWYGSNESIGTWMASHVDPPWGLEHGVRPGQTFGIRDGWVVKTLLDYYLRQMLRANVTVSADALAFDVAARPLGSTFPWYDAADVAQAIFYANFTADTCDTPGDKFACAVTNVAKAVSKAIRDAPYVANGTSGADMAVGQTMVTVTYVRVRWGWLALPVLVWVLGVVTWIGTAWKTRRAKIQTWRSSPLPLLFLYREQDSQREREDAAAYGPSDEGYERRAEDIRARLSVKRDGARLVGS